MHVPTIKKIHKSATIRRDNGDSIDLSNGHYLVRIPAAVWPADLARFSGRAPGPNGSAKDIEPYTEGQTQPNFEAVFPDGFIWEREAGDFVRLHFPEWQGQTITQVKGPDGRPCTPLAPLDDASGESGWILLDSAYFEPLDRLGFTFASGPQNGDGKIPDCSPVVLLLGREVYGLVMPLRKS